MAKVRVHELAKELGIESKELLANLKEQDEFVKTASSTIEAPVVRKIRENPPASAKGGDQTGAGSAADKPAAPKPGAKAAAPKPAAKPGAATPSPAGARPGPKPCRTSRPSRRPLPRDRRFQTSRHRFPRDR